MAVRFCEICKKNVSVPHLHDEMTDREFEDLKIQIEMKMDELDDLQKIYNNQTGQDFVRPLRLRRLTNAK